MRQRRLTPRKTTTFHAFKIFFFVGGCHCTGVLLSFVVVRTTFGAAIVKRKWVKQWHSFF